MWGMKSDLPPWTRTLIVFVVAGVIAVFLVQSLRYVDKKQRIKEERGPAGTTGTQKGTSEAAASHGSEPTIAGKAEVAKTPVPPTVQLIFKESVLLTPERKKRITEDIDGVAHYLRGLGPLAIPIPDDLPPIGIDTTNPKGEGWSFNSRSDHKYYYDQFTLQQGALDKQTKITEAFLSFVVGRFTYKPPPPMPPNLGEMTSQQYWEYTHSPEAMDQSYRWMTSVVVVQYLNHSYWNRPFAKNEKPECPDQGNGMSFYFWRMRERFGREFADKLAMFTVRASMDSPYTGAHADAVHPYRHYLYERLTLADSVIDNERSKMPEIDSILSDCGWLPLT